jgi:hypothetical protein
MIILSGLCLLTSSYAQNAEFRTGISTGYYFLRLPGQTSVTTRGSSFTSRSERYGPTLYTNPGGQIDLSVRLYRHLQLSIQTGYQSGRNEQPIQSGTRNLRGVPVPYTITGYRWSRAYWAQASLRIPLYQRRFPDRLWLGVGIARLAYHYEYLSELVINGDLNTIDSRKRVRAQASRWTYPLQLSYRQPLRPQLDLQLMVQLTSLDPDQYHAGLTAGVQYQW